MKPRRIHLHTHMHTCPVQAWEIELAQQDRNLLETETATLDAINAHVDMHA